MTDKIKFGQVWQYEATPTILLCREGDSRVWKGLSPWTGIILPWSGLPSMAGEGLDGWKRLDKEKK